MIKRFLSLPLEQILIISSEWVYVYSIYRFLGAFFDKTTVKSKVYEICSYSAQIVINIIMFLLCKVPLVYMIVNVGMVILIAINYEGSWVRCIIAACMLYATGAIIEILFFGFSAKTNFMKSTSVDVTASGIIFTRIVYLSIAVIVEKLGNLHKGESVPSVCWFSITVLPFINLAVAIFISSSKMNKIYFVLTIFLFFVENVLMYFIFDRMAALQEKSRRALVSDLQNESYRKQLAIMNESLQATKVMRHDIKNQMFTVQGLLEAGNVAGAVEHVHAMTGTYAAVYKSVNTGNVEVDSLINFKMYQAERKHIFVNTNISIPEQLGFSSFDMAVVIGNLFDNAFDALERIPESERQLQVCIRYSKGRIFIIVENTYTGAVTWKNGIPVTIKQNREMHGVGLSEVFATAAKYNGQVDITAGEKKFKVTVMMYAAILTV